MEYTIFQLDRMYYEYHRHSIISYAMHSPMDCYLTGMDMSQILKRFSYLIKQ
jgi:hypothetical protein